MAITQFNYDQVTQFTNHYTHTPTAQPLNLKLNAANRFAISNAKVFAIPDNSIIIQEENSGHSYQQGSVRGKNLTFVAIPPAGGRIDPSHPNGNYQITGFFRLNCHGEGVIVFHLENTLNSFERLEITVDMHGTASQLATNFRNKQYPNFSITITARNTGAGNLLAARSYQGYTHYPNYKQYDGRPVADRKIAFAFFDAGLDKKVALIDEEVFEEDGTPIADNLLPIEYNVAVGQNRSGVPIAYMSLKFNFDDDTYCYATDEDGTILFNNSLTDANTRWTDQQGVELTTHPQGEYILLEVRRIPAGQTRVETRKRVNYAIMKQGFIPRIVTNYNLNRATVIDDLVADPYHSGTDFTTLTEISTADQMYDYIKKLEYENPVEGLLVSGTGKTMVLNTNWSIRLNNAITTPMTIDTANNILRVKVAAGGIATTTKFELFQGTVDASLDGQLSLLYLSSTGKVAISVTTTVVAGLSNYTAVAWKKAQGLDDRTGAIGVAFNGQTGVISGLDPNTDYFVEVDSFGAYRQRYEINTGGFGNTLGGVTLSRITDVQGNNLLVDSITTANQFFVAMFVYDGTNNLIKLKLPADPTANTNYDGRWDAVTKVWKFKSEDHSIIAYIIDSLQSTVQFIEQHSHVILIRAGEFVLDATTQLKIVQHEDNKTQVLGCSFDLMAFTLRKEGSNEANFVDQTHGAILVAISNPVFLTVPQSTFTAVLDGIPAKVEESDTIKLVKDSYGNDGKFTAEVLENAPAGGGGGGGGLTTAQSQALTRLNNSYTADGTQFTATVLANASVDLTPVTNRLTEIYNNLFAKVYVTGADVVAGETPLPLDAPVPAPNWYIGHAVMFVVNGQSVYREVDQHPNNALLTIGGFPFDIPNGTTIYISKERIYESRLTGIDTKADDIKASTDALTPTAIANQVGATLDLDDTKGTIAKYDGIIESRTHQPDPYTTVNYYGFKTRTLESIALSTTDKDALVNAINTNLSLGDLKKSIENLEKGLIFKSFETTAEITNGNNPIPLPSDTTPAISSLIDYPCLFTVAGTPYFETIEQNSISQIQLEGGVPITMPVGTHVTILYNVSDVTIEKIKTVVDALKTASDDNATAIADIQAKSTQTKAVVDASKIVIDDTKTVADNTKSVVDSTKAVADDIKTVADDTKAVVDASKIVIDNTKTVADGIDTKATDIKTTADQLAVDLTTTTIADAVDTKLALADTKQYMANLWSLIESTDGTTFKFKDGVLPATDSANIVEILNGQKQGLIPESYNLTARTPINDSFLDAGSSNGDYLNHIVIINSAPYLVSVYDQPNNRYQLNQPASTAFEVGTTVYKTIWTRWMLFTAESPIQQFRSAIEPTLSRIETMNEYIQASSTDQDFDVTTQINTVDLNYQNVEHITIPASITDPADYVGYDLHVSHVKDDTDIFGSAIKVPDGVESYEITEFIEEAGVRKFKISPALKRTILVGSSVRISNFLNAKTTATISNVSDLDSKLDAKFTQQQTYLDGKFEDIAGDTETSRKAVTEFSYLMTTAVAHTDGTNPVRKIPAFGSSSIDYVGKDIVIETGNFEKYKIESYNNDDTFTLNRDLVESSPENTRVTIYGAIASKGGVGSLFKNR